MAGSCGPLANDSTTQNGLARHRPRRGPDVVGTAQPGRLKPQGAAVGQARQFRPDLGLRPLAGLRKRPLRWRPGPGGAGNRRGPRRGTRMAEIPRIPGNRPDRPASEAHTTAFSGPDAETPPYHPTAASNRHHAAAQGTSWRLVGCREAHSRRRRPRGAPMDESSQPLANGTSATLRPPMVARASSGLARAAHRCRGVPEKTTSPKRTSRSTWRPAPSPAQPVMLPTPCGPSAPGPTGWVRPIRSRVFNSTRRSVAYAPCGPSAWQLERAKAVR